MEISNTNVKKYYNHNFLRLIDKVTDGFSTINYSVRSLTPRAVRFIGSH